MSSRNKRWLRRAEWVTLLIGLAAIGYYGYVFFEARRYQAQELEALSQIQTEPSTTRVEPRIQPQPGSLVGRVEIPRIGLSSAILEGIDAKTLRRGLGHIPGTALPGESGNMGVAGHRDTFFRPLQGIRPDDTIRLITVNGSYEYKVGSIEVVEPHETRVLSPSSDSVLTLVTCYPFYYVGPAPKRFIVRAQRVSEAATLQ